MVTKTRMLKDDRDIIATSMVKHKFDPLFAALQETRHQLADELYAQVHGDWLETMAKMPVGAFDEVSNMSVRAYGRYITLRFRDEEKRRVFDALTRHSYELGATDLAQRIEASSTAEYDLRKQYDELRFKVKVTLDKFRNFEDAVEAWPEAEKFIAARMADRGVYVKHNLPAVLLIDLNKELDLPPEEAEAA